MHWEASRFRYTLLLFADIYAIASRDLETFPEFLDSLNDDRQRTKSFVDSMKFSYSGQSFEKTIGVSVTVRRYIFMSQRNSSSRVIDRC